MPIPGREVHVDEVAHRPEGAPGPRGLEQVVVEVAEGSAEDQDQRRQVDAVATGRAQPIRALKAARTFFLLVREVGCVCECCIQVLHVTQQRNQRRPVLGLLKKGQYPGSGKYKKKKGNNAKGRK